MILDEMTLYLKELLLQGKGNIPPMVIERFFRVIAESKGLLALGSDSEFVLSLALFKMVESLEVKDIDTMIRSLEQELQGVNVGKIASSAPTAEATLTSEVITITEEEITQTSVKPEPTTPEQEKCETAEARDASEEIPSSATVTPATPQPTIDPYQKTFDALLKKIYDRDYDLGACFERNIAFESFKEHQLTWSSTAEGEDKKMLITHWNVINMFVKDLFGFETKIINLPKKKVTTEFPDAEEVSAVHDDADSTSMIEDIEMKSSCIAPESGDTEAAKEKDPSTLLEEPMIKEAIALFDPKKVRIKRNS
jgi:DNA polymerase-3 subunit gamma/tau